jgi:hypothetical protein
MPLLALSNGQKKAAKRKARKQSSLAAAELPSSTSEYTLVGTVKLERLETPAIPLIQSYDSTRSAPNGSISAPQCFSSAPPDPTTAGLQQLLPSNTDMFRVQSPDPSPTSSTRSLESLDSFDRGFAISTSLCVPSLCEHSEFSGVSNGEHTSSVPESAGGIHDEEPTPLAFSQNFVDELSIPTFTTAAASSKAFEEALSRNSESKESSIFTRLRAMTAPSASEPVYSSKSPLTTVNAKNERRDFSEYALEKYGLVKYCGLSLISYETGYEMSRTVDEDSTDLSLETILSSRMFLASMDGVIQCIDYNQLLHNVETTEDDGGSDFDSIASPTKTDLDDLDDECNKVPESISGNIQLGVAIHDRLRGAKDTAQVESLELPGWCLQPIEKTDSDQMALSVFTSGPGLGSQDAKSVGTEEDPDLVVKQRTDLQSTTCPDRKEEVSAASQTTNSIEEPASAASTASQASDASEWAYDLSRMRLGTESLFSYLEVLEVANSGKASRGAVVTAFLKLVNLERKKRGAHALPSLCSAHSVLRSNILSHTTMLGTTTVASFVAQLDFDERDEVEMVGVYAAWDRLGREEVRHQQVASGGIMGVLGRALGRLI